MPPSTEQQPGFLDGLRCFSDGVRDLPAPGVRAHVWLPLSVSLLVVTAALWLGFSYLSEFRAWFEDLLPDWLDFLAVVLVPLISILAVLVGAWLAGFLALIIAAPFFGTLSLAVETRIGIRDTLPDIPWYAGLGATLIRELRKLGYQIPRALLVLLISLVPLLSPVAPGIWLLLGAWLLAIQFADIPAENRNIEFGTTRRLLNRYRTATLGFGVVTTALLAIPFANFLVLPAAVAGGTRLYHRLKRADAAAV